MKLTIMWKDDQEQTEVSIVFGTLVPFFSTGIRKLYLNLLNFFKVSMRIEEANLALQESSTTNE